MPIARCSTPPPSTASRTASISPAATRATVGGTIATNAGGLRVLRYGDTRAQVVGIEAVLGDGSVVSHLAGLPRDNTGYHLPSLLAGSEGTLGVVTRARLRLVPGDHVAHAWRCCVRLDARRGRGDHAAAGVVRHARGDRAVPAVGPRAGVHGQRPGAAVPAAAGHGAYLLVEAAGRRDTSDDLADAVASLDGVLDAAVASDAVRRAALWAYREQHTEAINRVGTPHKLDVAVPLRRARALPRRSAGGRRVGRARRRARGCSATPPTATCT